MLGQTTVTWLLSPGNAVAVPQAAGQGGRSAALPRDQHLLPLRPPRPLGVPPPPLRSRGDVSSPSGEAMASGPHVGPVLRALIYGSNFSVRRDYWNE